MAEHSELIKEMVELEKMPSQDRLKLAKKRRQSQLKKCLESEKKQEKYEKQAQKRKSKAQSVMHGLSHPPPSRLESTRTSRVRFDKGIMLLEAAARNDVNEVRALLEEGVNPDVANEDGLTALHQCSIDDSEDMVLLLLEYGANVNAKDSELWTPLHAASTCANLRICQHLLSKDADTLAVNADGNMPYDICEDEKTLEYIETEMARHGITQELIDETRLSTEKTMMQDMKEYERDGNDLTLWRDRTGATLLHIAAAYGYADVTSYLLSKRNDVNAMDSDGWTPAMAAACWGQVPVLELLAKNGADLEVKTRDNKTLIDLVEDVDVKEQITEIKMEVKVDLERFRRAQGDLKRRSSTSIRRASVGTASIYNSNASLTDHNPFSSSIHRHSMREKHRMSMREARDEAQIRITINTDNEDSSVPSSPNDLPIGQGDKVEAPAMPVTNIDDLEVVISDDNVTTIHINQPPSKENAETAISDLAVKPNLIATISVTDEGEVSPTPPRREPPEGAAQVEPHMNGETGSGGEHGRNGNTVSMKVGILKHSTDTPVHGGDTAEGNSKYKQSHGANSNHPAHHAHDPPVRRFTSYGQPIEGDKKAKGCCVIS
ncbi:protein phosphatase 1 regulatory subunit 16A-like isoform X2 [Watersipora subatra]|uniref:protein phosphatase 1 regulatory subunit 16A-like isoform X2 n=1 Tax=Watersipora subatra TaxID=2589382 RepID=UPI00355C656A